MKITFEGNKKVKVRVKNFDVWTDQPKEQGGDESAPTPIDLFLASLGSCSGVFVLHFLRQHSLPENVYLTLDPVWNIKEYVIEKIKVVIHVPADFPSKYEHALIESAKRCLVARHVNVEHEITLTHQD